MVADLGAATFTEEEDAVTRLEWSIIWGKITNAEILSGLNSAVTDLVAADDILAQTSLDDLVADSNLLWPFKLTPASEYRDLILRRDPAFQSGVAVASNLVHPSHDFREVNAEVG